MKTMTYQVDERIARITLNRPERGNGITLDMPVELARKRRQKRGGEPDRLERVGDELQERVARAGEDVGDDAKPREKDDRESSHEPTWQAGKKAGNE